jgi:hypothetical protein
MRSWPGKSGSDFYGILMGQGAACAIMNQAGPLENYNAQAKALGWAAHCDPTLHFDWPGFADLVRLWNDLRGDAVLPMREAMTARRLKDLLPNIALYERFVGPDGNYRHRVRLEGMRFVRIYGTHTGQLVQDFLSPENAARFCAGLDTTLAMMAPLRFLARTDSADANFLSAEFCVLPLADREGEPGMIMLCVRFSPTPWEDYIETALERLKLAQAKSLASAARASALSTAI